MATQHVMAKSNWPHQQDQQQRLQQVLGANAVRLTHELMRSVCVCVRVCVGVYSPATFRTSESASTSAV